MSDYCRNLSLNLSRVMDDIGVSEGCVMKRRRTHLIEENLATLHDTQIQKNVTTHLFGSQTEGTTTPGLQSDTDLLLVEEAFNVIHDCKDWVRGKINLLMIQDDVLRPGYCKLRRLRDDKPLAMVVLPDKRYVYDKNRRVLLKSDYFKAPEHLAQLYGSTRNPIEPICAFPSPTLSNQYKEWSSRQRPFNWPTLDMIEYMGNTRCFVVPYVHLDEERPNIDWRISTSLAERFLMFSLNITQIRCYVLLKMIVKTFIEPHIPDVISNNICKTLLFHCLEMTRKDFWIEQNLVQCVNHVLLYMLDVVHNMDCPNYFNESSNLLFGKIDDEIREQLFARIRVVVRSEGRFLLKIACDDISSRLTRYIRDGNLLLSFDENEKRKSEICGGEALHIGEKVGKQYINIVLDTDDFDIPRDRILLNIIDFIKNGGLLRRAGMLMLPFFCSYIATVDACALIMQGQDISPRTLQLYKLSLRSDVASSRLKYASFLYCTGQFQGTLSVLRDLERSLTRKVVPFCACISEIRITTRQFNKAERQNVYPSTANLAFCVIFTRAEIQCCPREMQFEFYRSTQVDKQHRREVHDDWMDWALLDCLPYLYYLQYMTAKHLGQQDLQCRALQNLEFHVCFEMSLGHRETAYNVLGQCLELENNMDRALMYYRRSLQVRPRNNAAKWHVARLCFNVFTRTKK